MPIEYYAILKQHAARSTFCADVNEHSNQTILFGWGQYSLHKGSKTDHAQEHMVPGTKHIATKMQLYWRNHTEK